MIGDPTPAPPQLTGYEEEGARVLAQMRQLELLCRVARGEVPYTQVPGFCEHRMQRTYCPLDH